MKPYTGTLLTEKIMKRGGGFLVSSECYMIPCKKKEKKVVTAKPVAWTHRDSNPIPDEFVRSASPPRLYWIVTSVKAYLKPEITGKKI